MALMAVVLIIKAHLSPGFPLDEDRRMDQAGSPDELPDGFDRFPTPYATYSD